MGSPLSLLSKTFLRNRLIQCLWLRVDNKGNCYVSDRNIVADKRDYIAKRGITGYIVK